MSLLGITLMTGLGGSANKGGQASAKQGLVPGVIAAGFSHSLSLGPDGTVWAWGSNASGELGIGTAGSAATPLPVKISGLTDVVAVSAGHGFSLALRADGTVWAWGKNDQGQLGNGKVDAGATPVPGKVPGLTDVVAVSAGHSFASALRADGTVWAWGNNRSGLLGVGSPSVLQVTAPAPVVGLSNVVSLAAAGGGYFLALRSDGTVWAWGHNGGHQLGEGPTLGMVKREPVQVKGLQNVVAISTGWAHALALSADGTVWTWGNNAHGQLGQLSPDINRAAVMAVPGLSDVVAIMAGPSSYRTLALRRDGTLWTWGMDRAGRAGNPPAPVQVPGLQDVVAVSSGTHALLLDKQGTLWGWGPNTAGELGDGTTQTRLMPVPVVGLSCRLPGGATGEPRALASRRCLGTP
ncbi:hypothetical protein [Archangium sp.]|jgi:alpha-tubulin suppressor-like RCC1 family protein|uniref:RCC1 domain-containing protein n=1 Tax=Archangium sp. TaxID=1872627 RepID=UPI002EDA568B